MYFIYVLKNIKTSNNVFNYLQIKSGVGDKINRIAFSKQLKYANNKKIPYAIAIGTDELKENKIKLKDMKKAEEFFISLEDAIKILK